MKNFEICVIFSWYACDAICDLKKFQIVSKASNKYRQRGKLKKQTVVILI